MTMKTITVNPRAVTGMLAAVAVFLVIAGIIAEVTRFSAGYPPATPFVRLFHLDLEANFPSYFSGLLLLSAALLLAFIAVRKRVEHASFASRWAMLSAGFLLMSVDEVVGLHELLMEPMRTYLGMSARGIFFFGWVVPGIAVAAAAALFFLTFLLHLPFRVRRGMMAAGALYLGGAIGMELVGGKFVVLYGMKTPGFAAIATVEESLEMAGAILFIHVLLGYIARQWPDARVRWRG